MCSSDLYLTYDGQPQTYISYCVGMYVAKTDQAVCTYSNVHSVFVWIPENGVYIRPSSVCLCSARRIRNRGTSRCGGTWRNGVSAHGFGIQSTRTYLHSLCVFLSFFLSFFCLEEGGQGVYITYMYIPTSRRRRRDTRLFIINLALSEIGRASCRERVF